MMLPLLLAASLAAHAGPYAEELAAMDANVAALQSMDLSGAPKDVTRAVEKGVRDLKQLQEQAAAAQKLGSSAHKARVFLRLAEGYVAFNTALLDAPCPTGLAGEPCALYQSTLAEKVVAFVGPAEKLSERIREQVIVGTSGVDRLKGKEKKQAKALRAEIAALADRARAAAPAEPAAPAKGLLAKWPDPVPFGAAAPLPDGVRPEADEPTPDPSGWYVQIDKTATLSAERAGGGPVLQAEQQAPTAGPPALMLARLVEEHGDRVRVELGAGDWRLHCAYDPPWDQAWRVFLWVDASALHPVTTEGFETAFEDGSGVALRAGVPVVEGGVWVDHLLVPVPLPPDAAGDRYREAPRAAFDDVDGAFIQREAALTLGGAPVEAHAHAYGTDGLRYTDTFTTTDDGVELVGFQGACGEVRLRVEGRDDMATGAGGLGVLGGMLGDPHQRFRLAAGTPLLWPDGSPAGVLTEERTVAERDFPERDGGLRCKTLDADWLDEGEDDWPERHVEVCVAPAP